LYSRARSQLTKWLRLAAVMLACLSTPTVRDVIGGEWLSDVECCADDCDESGDACTQQCEHCICGHFVTVPTIASGRALVVQMVTTIPSMERSGARSGHLDPPFRPPVS
jgi:hypothetical protein